MKLLRRRLLTRRTVAFIASLGGHMDELVNLQLDTSAPTVWITSEGVRAQQLRDAGETVRTLPRLDSSIGASWSTLLIMLRGVLLALRLRPRVVVTSGAGLAVPFSATASLLGAELIFIESLARVETASRSARLLAPFAGVRYVQWPAARRAQPGAHLARPTRLSVGKERQKVSGTFITLGTHTQSFGRLRDLVIDAVRQGSILPHPVTIQAGETSFDAIAGLEAVTVHAYLPETEYSRELDRASVVICHAGAGAMTGAIARGKRPLVMPRNATEHVDDHQFELVEALRKLDLVDVITDHLTKHQVDGLRKRPLKDPYAACKAPTIKEAVEQLPCWPVR